MEHLTQAECRKRALAWAVAYMQLHKAGPHNDSLIGKEVETWEALEEVFTALEDLAATVQAYEFAPHADLTDADVELTDQSDPVQLHAELIRLRGHFKKAVDLAVDQVLEIDRLQTELDEARGHILAASEPANAVAT